MSDRPIITVIFTTSNCIDSIARCIDTVLDQSLWEIEVIIVDVLSTDGTKEYIENLAKDDDRVVFLADSMGSMGHAKNMALNYARAPYVIFLEQGDYLKKDALEILYHSMEEEPDSNVTVFETDSFGNDSFGRTNKEIKDRINEANRTDRRKFDRESRLFRWFAFQCNAIYRTDFVRDNKIFHYDRPGVGSQDIAFRYLTLACRPFGINAMCLCSHELDEHMDPDGQIELISDAKAISDVCNEYRYLKQELKKDKNLWNKNRHTFWNSYFAGNLEYYRRLRANLRPALSQRMQSDIAQAIKNREFSEEHFEVMFIDELKLLLKSTTDFDRIEKDKEMKRNKERLERYSKEKNMEQIPDAVVDAEIEGHPTDDSTQTMQSHLDKKWLLEEMSKDLMPLRILLGFSVEEMGSILDISASTYKSFETGKRDISWEMYMALLFVFCSNERTASVVDSLGLYPNPLKLRMRKGLGVGY